MKKCLVVGGNGREASIVSALKDTCQVYAVLAHRNPTIIDIVTQTGGKYLIDNPKIGEIVSGFAQENKIDLAIVNSDEILAAGVVDYLKQANIPTFGPTQEGAKVEWSKSYSRVLVDQVVPQGNPLYRIVSSIDGLTDIEQYFQGKEVVVKPDGLTGGKGVKVMGAHLKDFEDAIAYAKELLSDYPEVPVVFEEKLGGYEFTIMGITDGHNIVFAPVTYDYPYRFDGDTGPGTGGMGCFTHENRLLPFLNEEDVLKCQEIMNKVVRKMNESGIIFNGVLNGGFFKTPDGQIKLMEFNSRIGDPEALNVMHLLETPLEMIEAVIHGNLSTDNCTFKPLASMVVYLVAQEYAMKASHSETVTFTFDAERFLEAGIHVNFSACERLDNGTYQSVGSSRLVGLVALDAKLELARGKIYKAIKAYSPNLLDHRKDIGDLKAFS